MGSPWDRHRLRPCVLKLNLEFNSVANLIVELVKPGNRGLESARVAWAAGTTSDGDTNTPAGAADPVLANWRRSRRIAQSCAGFDTGQIKVADLLGKSAGGEQQK